MPSIFDAYRLGPVEMKNHIVMAPMTRSRAVTLAPDDDTVTYYRQRAGAGLIITEGTPVSEQGRGYAFTPGIYAPDQIAGWARVTEAVHGAGGKIFCQLWHVGRQSHVSLQPGRGAPVSSVAVAAQIDAWGFDDSGVAGPVPSSLPRALREAEVAGVKADFVQAARNARAAGFDGVEIHGANGYLFEQFINGGLNQRTDRYGGSIENRLRFALETVDAVAAAIGPERTGIRLAPFGSYGDMHRFADETETWLAMARAMGQRDIAYVHLSDQTTLGQPGMPNGFVDLFRKSYGKRLLLAAGFNQETAQAALDAGRADLIAIGRLFISNPDLIERFRTGAPIVPPEPEWFYTGGRRGYIDYPALGG
jgi:2,4-dienoyl-CoA reductase-like NADH-dependent reductase (Old Yellow Enzyme family)